MSERDERDERDGETRRFERRLPHAPEKVWRALTEAEELAGWFPEPDAPDAERTVIEADPPRRLVCTFGDETLTWELTPTPDGCVLVLTTEVAPAAANDASGFRCAA